MLQQGLCTISEAVALGFAAPSSSSSSPPLNSSNSGSSNDGSGGLPMAAQDHLNASLAIGQEVVGEFEEALR